jgi:hypothetical protein
MATDGAAEADGRGEAEAVVVAAAMTGGAVGGDRAISSAASADVLLLGMAVNSYDGNGTLCTR